MKTILALIISDQKSGKEFVWTEYTITSCHSIQIRPTNRPNRWSIQQYNMYCSSNIDDRMYCQRKLKGETNINICLLTMGKENISQKKNVIRNIYFLHFLQHTNKTCRNQHMRQWTR
jgi:predicted nuclease of restriction endonuclease-like (RecB) superfamily